MKRIYKYLVEIQDEQTIYLPIGAQILSVQVQNGKPYIWACVRLDVEIEARRFRLYGTGHNIEGENVLKYLGTFQLLGGRLVYHLFEVV